MISKSFSKNFNLLAVSRLIQETILWYSIFIAFAYSINLSLQQISFSIIAVNVGVILFEVPSGVLADRWSRKWTLALATVTLMAATLVISLSHGSTQYILGSFLWGVFFALQSGTPESLIYDMLKKEDKANLYKKYLARFALSGTIGLILGSVMGSIVADVISLRAAYLLTLIPSAISLSFLALVNEPKEHQLAQTFSHIQHYKVAFNYLVKNRLALRATLILILIATATSFIFELNQVYYYAAGLPLVLYGIFNSSLQLSTGSGPWLASRISSRKAIIASVVIVIISLTYVLFNVNIFSAILLSVILMLIYFLDTAYGHFLQDKIASEVRAAAGSMVSTGGRLIFTAVIALFGIINTSRESVNGFILLMVLIFLIVLLIPNTLHDMESFDKTQKYEA